ncbi:hypothetical protein EUX98_g2750 [Antrodiella citrinella]|uniref:Uncharacterized protein n=1 Tax=Antrodiella citrinella TaxID=2447956 RepID=A0A4S4MZM2_9APHY|nr:hypothetical protein EUX98_g2750 [Antrodiella citrinella]
MKFLVLAAATLAAVAPALAQATLGVDTVAGITQCQPILFTWHGGVAPYFLSLIPAAQPSAPALKQFPTQNGTSFTWLTDLPTGSTFTIALKDSTGATAFSDIETVNNSSDTSCLNTAVTDSGTGGTAAPVGSSTPTGSSAPTSAASSGQKSNDAVKITVGSFGIAAVMGLIGAALF